MLLFAPYEKNSLKNDPVVSMLGKWEIHYLAFEGPQDCQKPPVIVLGGAFQNFTSYRFFTSDVLEFAPIILVDLPSLGNNAQLAANLGLEDLADLLYYWLVQEGIPKVSLMGLSPQATVSGANWRVSTAALSSSNQGSGSPSSANCSCYHSALRP